ncbi:MAG: sulfatase-like hydrolase/transferase [Verrucomicrobiae bacterium]|nr:sulfatase-like hydrolase/transferase [Verrucomicrobiae bacterium]
MKQFLTLLLLFLLQPLAVSIRANPPNFLFLFIDDQGWNGTPVPMIPGKEFSRTQDFHMPNVERVASRGITFSQAYAAHPKCECSRASVQMGMTTTSLNATDKWATNWNAPVSDSLANTLKRANPDYRAAHLGKWQWPQTPESMGYDFSDGITMNADGDSDDPEDPKQTFGITRRAEDYMTKQVKDGHPSFLQLSYYAVHSQPQALATTLEKYNAMGQRALMAAMSEDLDTSIGTLLKKLETLGISQNTYVIYMSDNGMRTGVLKGGKATVDEGGLRVPLIVTGPGIKGGVYSNERVVGYDVFPTIVDLAAPGFSLPKGVEGGSWKPILLDGGDGHINRPIDRMVFHHGVEVEHPQTAIYRGDYKLLYWWDTKESFLYKIVDDLYEKNNLAQEKPELAAQMLGELQAHAKAGLDKETFAALERGEVKSGRRQGGGGNRGGQRNRGDRSSRGDGQNRENRQNQRP